jgi:hypothetical protein
MADFSRRYATMICSFALQALKGPPEVMRHYVTKNSLRSINDPI